MNFSSNLCINFVIKSCKNSDFSVFVAKNQICAIGIQRENCISCCMKRRKRKEKWKMAPLESKTYAALFNWGSDRPKVCFQAPVKLMLKKLRWEDQWFFIFKEYLKE